MSSKETFKFVTVKFKNICHHRLQSIQQKFRLYKYPLTTQSQGIFLFTMLIKYFLKIFLVNTTTEVQAVTSEALLFS